MQINFLIGGHDAPFLLTELSRNEDRNLSIDRLLSKWYILLSQFYNVENRSFTSYMVMDDVLINNIPKLLISNQ